MFGSRNIPNSAKLIFGQTVVLPHQLWGQISLKRFLKFFFASCKGLNLKLKKIKIKLFLPFSRDINNFENGHFSPNIQNWPTSCAYSSLGYTPVSSWNKCIIVSSVSFPGKSFARFYYMQLRVHVVTSVHQKIKLYEKPCEKLVRSLASLYIQACRSLSQASHKACDKACHTS